MASLILPYKPLSLSVSSVLLSILPSSFFVMCLIFLIFTNFLHPISLFAPHSPFFGDVFLKTVGFHKYLLSLYRMGTQNFLRPWNHNLSLRAMREITPNSCQPPLRVVERHPDALPSLCGFFAKLENLYD
ncbi:hypothetical protein U1Q18_035973 [Sarracenia purpurea var. burkii]